MNPQQVPTYPPNFGAYTLPQPPPLPFHTVVGQPDSIPLPIPLQANQQQLAPQVVLVPFPVQLPIVDYPYVFTGKYSMALLSPDGFRAMLLTVQYPTSVWQQPKLSIHRGGPGGPAIGGAKFHSFTTEKVDAHIGLQKYRFKGKFESQTGLGKLEWSIVTGTLVLEADGVIIVRFVPRDAIVGGMLRPEGKFEIRRPGLNDAQFEEVVVTGIAELERIRLYAENNAVAVGG
jgi:hypothetical protein